MNTIRKNQFKKELFYNNTLILKYTIEYPEITSSDYVFGKELFNNYNKRNAIAFRNYCEQELYQMAVESYKYSVANGYPIMVYEAVLAYKITYNKNCIISLYSDKYIFSGGAHGNTIRTAQNWNLKFGRTISLSNLFPNNPYYITNILTQINNIIAEQIKNGTGQYFDNHCQLSIQNFNLNNFYLTPDSLVIFYQQYDIAPYSSGIPEFKMPYNTIKAQLPNCF